jgi:FkbM family methyltransferase
MTETPIPRPASGETVERHVAELAAQLAINCVIDVGANRGQWARALRAAGYRGRIVSFEPIRASFEELSAAAAGDPDWVVHQLALGESDGSLLLHRTENTQLASALPPSEFARLRLPEEIAIVAEDRVPVRRLDAIFPELTAGLGLPRVLLKIDTQGYDLRVFEGARGALPWILAVQSELSVQPLYQGMPSYVESLAVFARHGFAPSGFFPIPRLGTSLVLCEFDCVLARHLRSLAALDGPLLPAVADARAAASGGSAPPPISVIVTACADSQALRACLSRVRVQADALGAEVLLAVNAAEESLGDAREALGKLCDRLVFEPRVGKSHALNAAVDAARGEVVAFTDDDAEPEDGWLALITAPLRAADRPVELVGCGGPVTPVFPPSGTPAWFRARVEEKRSYFLGPRHEPSDDALDYSLDHRLQTGVPIGANCAYRREVFAFYRYDPRLGPNRETGMRGGEDSLIAMMLLLDGYRLQYLPEARVSHPVDLGRAAVSIARRGYFMQGVEFVRIRHLLEVTLPPPAYFRRKLRGVRLKMWVARLQFALRGGEKREKRWLHRSFKVQRMRGILAEFRSPFGRW